jgi:hypothetical protein
VRSATGFSASWSFTTARPQVVSAGLLSQWVARLAKNGTDPGNNVDPTSTWRDLTDDRDGALANFAYTEVSGWAGTGTDADSYRLVFDANGEVVTAPSLGFGTSNFTVEAWAEQAASSVYGGVVGCWDGDEPWNTDVGWALYFGGGRQRFQCNDGNYANFDTQWGDDLRGTGLHHIVYRYDGSVISLYVDGTFVTQAAYSGAGTGNPTGSLKIGKFWAGTLDGSIAGVRVYGRCLSPAEVQQNYSAGPQGATRIRTAAGFCSSGSRSASTAGAVRAAQGFASSGARGSASAAAVRAGAGFASSGARTAGAGGRVRQGVGFASSGSRSSATGAAIRAAQGFASSGARTAGVAGAVRHGVGFSNATGGASAWAAATRAGAGFASSWSATSATGNVAGEVRPASGWSRGGSAGWASGSIFVPAELTIGRPVRGRFVLGEHYEAWAVLRPAPDSVGLGEHTEDWDLDGPAPARIKIGEPK